MEGEPTVSNIADVKKERIKMTPLDIATRRSLLTLARSVSVEVGRYTTFLRSLAVKGLYGGCDLSLLPPKKKLRNVYFVFVFF